MERINVNCDYMIYSDEEKKRALECLENSDSSICVGNTVSSFEQKLSKYLNVPYAIALPNCTLSIYTALQVLGIENGDEVKKGAKIMELDLDYIKKNAPSLVSPVICSELSDNQRIRLLSEGEVKAGDELFAVDFYE